VRAACPAAVVAVLLSPVAVLAVLLSPVAVLAVGPAAAEPSVRTPAVASDALTDIEGPAGTTKVPTGGATALMLADKQFAGSGSGQFGNGQFGSCSTVAIDGPAVIVGCAYSPELWWLASNSSEKVVYHVPATSLTCAR